MKISPITNQYNNNQNSFKSANTTRLILNNFDMATKEFFQSGIFYKELAKIDYSNAVNRTQLFNLFKHATNVLKIDDKDLHADTAILEGIRNNNVDYLKVLMEGRELVPVQSDGEVSVDVILEGRNHSNPQIRSFFEREYLEKRAVNRELLAMEEAPKLFQIYEGRDIFNSIMGINKKEPVFEKNNDETLKNIKTRIEMDEENFGQVQLSTLEKIVNLPGFEYVKNESLNVSGSKLLHLLAETPINRHELPIFNSIINKCRIIDYDFSITNDFGETAFDKAKEAENYLFLRYFR